jgi:hypothetical protein
MPEAPPVTSADMPGLSSIPPARRWTERPKGCCRGVAGWTAREPDEGGLEEGTARQARGADEDEMGKDAVGFVYSAPLLRLRSHFRLSCTCVASA